MKSDLDISREAEVRPISELAEMMGIPSCELIPYGRDMAKIPLDVLKRFDDKKDGS